MSDVIAEINAESATMADSVGSAIVVQAEEQSPTEVNNGELVARALLVFWSCGIVSVLVDLDHYWSLLGLEEPFNLTGWVGRPLHHPLVYLLLGIICGVLTVALVNGWNVHVPVRSENLK